jgi:hypothetical protein
MNMRLAPWHEDSPVALDNFFENETLMQRLTLRYTFHSE